MVSLVTEKTGCFYVFVHFRQKGKVTKQHILIGVSPYYLNHTVNFSVVGNQSTQSTYSSDIDEKTLLRIEHATTQVKDKWFNNSNSRFKSLDLHDTEVV